MPHPKYLSLWETEARQHKCNQDVAAEGGIGLTLGGFGHLLVTTFLSPFWYRFWSLFCLSPFASPVSDAIKMLH